MYLSHGIVCITCIVLCVLYVLYVLYVFFVLYELYVFFVLYIFYFSFNFCCVFAHVVLNVAIDVNSSVCNPMVFSTFMVILDIFGGCTLLFSHHRRE